MSVGRAARLLAALGTLSLSAGFSEPRARGARAHTATWAAEARAAGARVVAHSDSARFLAAAREGTRRYQSQQAAIDDGFTRVGGEFPAMGEHWVSFARVMEDSLAADRPSILIYVNGADGPRLSGVAYTKLLVGSGRPPAFPSPDAWHAHNGEVGEESLPARHAAAAHATSTRVGDRAEDGDAPRLFVLHAWVWTPNPDGAFVTDNWALPFARHDVAPPAARARDAACALALADDRDEYYRTTLRAALALAAGEDALAARVLAGHRPRAEDDARRVRAAGRLTSADAGRLAAGCDALWSDLEAALPARAAELRRLRRQM